MSYAITAFVNGKLVRETRARKGSAAMLAKVWTAEGRSDVRIAAGDQHYTLSAFYQYVLLPSLGLDFDRSFTRSAGGF